MTFSLLNPVNMLYKVKFLNFNKYGVSKYEDVNNENQIMAFCGSDPVGNKIITNYLGIMNYQGHMVSITRCANYRY